MLRAIFIALAALFLGFKPASAGVGPAPEVSVQLAEAKAPSEGVRLAFWQSRDSNYNVAISSAAAPSYTFISAASSTGSGSNLSTSMNLGGNATCFAVAAVIAQGQNSTLSLSIAGTALTQDRKDTHPVFNFTSAIFSGALSNCSGSQTVALTTNVGAFTLRGLAVWVVKNNASNSPIATAGYNRNGGTQTPASPTVSVNSGDLLFGSSYMIATGITCGGSSVAPNAVNTINTTGNVGADWLITSTNASFALNCTSGNDGAASFATYR